MPDTTPEHATLDGLRQRLHALRPRESAPPAVARAPDPAWAERLARLRQLAADRPGPALAHGRTHAGTESGLPGREIAPGLHLHEVRVGELRVRLAGLELPERLCAPWAPGETPVRADLCLFDTETSGLVGGAGLKVFLLGTLRWDGEGWLLRQYLLTRMRGEAALVEAWVAECRSASRLVSYNGKRFDVPAMRTLETLHGRDAGASERGHWDLLYPVRRAFRGHWPDCRLTTAERMLAGRERAHDLPGSEAPRVWREYLVRGETRDLVRVMQHNRMDLEALLRVLRALLAMPCERFAPKRSRSSAKGQSLVPARSGRPRS